VAQVPEGGREMKESLAVWLELTASDQKLQVIMSRNRMSTLELHYVWPGRFTLKQLLQLLGQCNKKGTSRDWQ